MLAYLAVAEIPMLSQILTVDYATRRLDEVARQVNDVVADYHFLDEGWIDGSGDHVVVIPHRCSRLRAKFTLPAPGAVIGYGMSKPYRIKSIAPACVDDDGTDGTSTRAWGSGRGSTGEAARLHPGVRWKAASLHAHSAGV